MHVINELFRTFAETTKQNNMTEHEKKQLIRAIETMGCPTPCSTIEDKQLYCSIITGLVSVKGLACKSDELKQKADELYFGIKSRPFYY